MLRPEWDTQAQVTSALSALRDQIPMTSSPRTLNTQTQISTSVFRTHTRGLCQFNWLGFLTSSRWPRWWRRFETALWSASQTALRTRVVYKRLWISVSRQREWALRQPDRQECEVWAKSAPGCRSCQQKSPSAWRSWGCLCSSWCGLAAGQASGRRSPRRTQWSRRPGSGSLDWTWNKEGKIDVEINCIHSHLTGL